MDSEDAKKQKKEDRLYAQSDVLNRCVADVAATMKLDSARQERNDAINNAKSLYDATNEDDDRQRWLLLLRGNTN